MHWAEGMNTYSSPNFCLYSCINACWWEKFLQPAGVELTPSEWHPFTSETSLSVCFYIWWLCLVYARCIDYMERSISMLGCLQDQAVCQSSGPDAPSLWRSHGSPANSAWLGNDLYCWTLPDDFSLAAFTAEQRDPTTLQPPAFHLPSIFLFCLFCFAKHLSRKKECGSFKQALD